MDSVMIYFLLLSNCGLVVRAFSLRSCYLSEDNAVCSQRKLKEVPTDIPPAVKSIDLSSNDIPKIQRSDFAHFPNLTTLDLKQNSISDIGRITFSQLVSLKRLLLNRNKLASLQDDVFDGLSKLMELQLGSNQIETVAPNAFRSLSSVLHLELSHNKLRTIAQVHLAVQYMPKLTQLGIGNNEISTFRSQDLTNVSTEITSLDVSGNPLVTFEVTADVFPKLKKLNIGSPTVKSNLTWAVQKRSLLHRVTSLDISAVQLASIDEWRKLLTTFHSSVKILKLDSVRPAPELINMCCMILIVTNLQIRTNALQSVRSSLFKMCHRLNNIDLKGNNITHIENGSFNVLRYLRTLSLSDNKLQNVPTATRNLHNLQTLDLSFNRIKMLRCQDFTGLTSLKVLNLHWNKIKALNKCSFVGLSKLEILNLQKNSISGLGSAFQSSLTNLKILQLNQNKLKVIKKSEFSGLLSLTNLSLYQNHIKTLEKGSFFGLASLLDLQLQQNKLRRDALDRTCFKDLVKLIRLNLDNNFIKYMNSSALEEPPFMDLSKLQILQISVQRGTGKSHFPSNFLQGLSNLLTLICNNIHLLNFPDDFFVQTPRLNNLDMGANDILDVPATLFFPIPNLTRLRVSSTNRHSLDFLIDSNLTKLKILQARKNTFSVIRKDIMRSVPSLLELDLTENSFTCDCDNSWFVQWIKNNNQTQVPGAYSFQCNYPPESRNTKLLDFNVQSCLVDVGFICFISSTCVNVVILVASFTFHFSRFHLTYTYYLFLAWLYDSRNRQKRAACGYDAFVSYNAHDEAWVYRELVPQLEQEQGWRLCLHHRDFLPGKPIVENIAEAIYGSRKTICVISSRYLQSEWCSKEMQLASFRLFDEREDVLILLFLEDIPSSHLSPYYRMKRLLKRHSYLSWPRAAQHPQLFWEKLRQALRSTNTEEEDRLRLTVTH